MNEKDLKSGLESIFTGLMSSRKTKLIQENEDKFKELFNKINLDDPELFFFQELYDKNSLLSVVINSKLESQGFNSNSSFTDMFLSYNDLENYLQEIFRKELGYICCADKAHFVLRRVLRLEKGDITASLRTKNQIKEYYDPFYRNLSNWHKLIKTCPIVNTHKAEEHAIILNKILKEMRRAKQLREDFIKKFSSWLLSSSYKESTCELSKNKIFTYELMFTKDPINAYDWLSRKNPEILKIYKKIYHNK